MVDRLIYNHKDNNEINKILYNKSQSANIFSKSINIYNPEADEPLQKFWFHIEKSKLLKKFRDKIQIVIFNKDENLINCIRSLDDKINNVVEKMFKVNKHHKRKEG